MVYRIDLTEPGLFWQLRKLERKTYGKTNNCNSTVRRVDGPSDRAGQGSSLRGKLCSANMDVRILTKGIQVEQNGGPNLFGLHDPYRDYGG